MMPTGSRHISQDFLRSWEAFDRTFAAQPVSPSDGDGDDSDSLNLHPPRNRPMAPEPFSTPLLSHASTSSSGPVTPDDSESLNRVWSAVRKAKEREMATSPSKIKSLERGRSPPPMLHSPLRGLPLEPSLQPAARVPSPSPAPALRRQRSM
jgi:hypothetical protein